MVQLGDVSWAGLLHCGGGWCGGPAQEPVPHRRAAPLLLHPSRPVHHPQGGDPPRTLQEVKTVGLIPELPASNHRPPHCSARCVLTSGLETGLGQTETGSRDMGGGGLSQSSGAVIIPLQQHYNHVTRITSFLMYPEELFSESSVTRPTD